MNFYNKTPFFKTSFLIGLIAFAAIIFFSSITGFAQAPAIEWQKTFGGSSSDEAQTIIQTRDGGYLMGGLSYSNDGDAAGNHSAFDSDILMIKLDPAGNIQWRKMIGGQYWEAVLSIKQTSDDGYIIAGHSYSNDGDIPANYGSFSSDALIVKLDQSGNIQWVKNYGGREEEVFISIEETKDGGYIAAGYTASLDGDVSGVHGDYDAWIVKLDGAGTIQWQKCIGGTQRDNAWSITASTDGGYVFTGNTKSTNGDIALNHGQYDFLVGKLDALGNVEWVKTLGGSLMEWSSSIVDASDGGFVIAGYSNSGNGDVQANYGLSDVWIIKIDNQGNIQWQKSSGGSNIDDATQIVKTKDGGYVVAGRTLSADGHVSMNNGNNDYWILKLDVNGNLQWEKSFGGSLQDVALSIQQTQDGGFIIAGQSYSDNGDVTTNLGRSDAWIVKLGLCTLNIPVLPAGITGAETPCAGTSVIYRIEAANDATGYTWKIPEGWTLVSGQGTNVITVIPGNKSGSVSVNAYNTCKSSPEKNIAVVPRNGDVPVATIISDAAGYICEGTPVKFTADAEGAIAPRYQWKKNGINTGTNASIYRDNSLKNGDIIFCEVSSTNSCGSQTVSTSPGITMLVSHLINPTISISSNTVSICKGAEVRLTATVTGEGINPNYQWFINDNGVGSDLPYFTSLTLSDGDVITCKVFSDELCAVSAEAESDPIIISVDTGTLAFVSITSTATTICRNDEVSFQATVVNAGNSPKYNWTINGVQTGADGQVLKTRDLSDKDIIACSITPGLNTCAVNTALSNTIAITINTLPQLTLYPRDTLVQSGTQIQFYTYINEDINSFSWSPPGMLMVPSVLAPKSAPILTAITYRLDIITKDGCPMFKTVTIKPLNPLFIPNAFTPNGDGLNDIFRIPPGSDLKLTELSIYSRWGKKIFITADINIGWDGRIKGVEQPSGTYIYMITGFQNDKPVFLKGTFNLLH